MRLYRAAGAVEQALIEHDGGLGPTMATMATMEREASRLFASLDRIRDVASDAR